MAACTNIFQQVFSLSLGICGASKQTGTVDSLQSYLAGKLNALLENPDFSNGDQWTLAWGPIVWQSPHSNVADQALAVCYNKTKNVYVVPIAATSPSSPFDIFLEDLAVSPGFMRTLGGSTGPSLSYGNYVALQVLLSLEDPNNKGSLAGFLAAAASTSGTVVFNGHSLGGGLAPLLAYSLYPAGTAKSGWENVYVYPSAGPTTADSTFASAFNTAYPVETVVTGTYQIWNANQYNGRDIVPHAWSTSAGGPTLTQVTAAVSRVFKPMFVTSLEMTAIIAGAREAAIGLASDAAGADPYTQVSSNLLFTADQQTSPLTDEKQLAAEVLYQHTTAYVNAYGVGTLFGDSAAEVIHPPLLPLLTGKPVPLPTETALV
jgi:Lipase (class 3).